MVWFVILETWGYGWVIKQLFPAPTWLITLLHAKTSKQIWKHLTAGMLSWQQTEAASTSYTKIPGWGGGGPSITAVTQVPKVGKLLPWAVGRVAPLLSHPGHDREQKVFFWGRPFCNYTEGAVLWHHLIPHQWGTKLRRRPGWCDVPHAELKQLIMTGDS